LSTDWYTRIVLTVIAVALVVLAVQGQQRSGLAAGEGRFRFTPVPIARLAIRLDSETGETWTALFPDLRVWTKVAETPGELLDRPPSPAAQGGASMEMMVEHHFDAPSGAPAPEAQGGEPSQP
jgi:hypothetical protein